jgi:Gpi18-like mannosyltransferase
LFLVNPIVWYNSALWGQTDSIINFLFMLAIWFLVKKKPVLSSLSLAISVYIKISLVIFLPIFAVLFIKQRFSFKKIFVSVALPIVFFVVLTLPFSYPAEPFSWSVALYKDKVLANQLQVITANAFNIWAFLTGIKERPHGQLLGPVSFQVWGVLLFLAAYLPLLYKAWKRPSFETIVWVLSLSAFSAFMLLTNMHERYLYPLFPYFTILIVLNLSLLPLYITISGANLLNMYHLWWVPKFSFSEAIFNFSDNLFPKTLSFLGLALYLLTYYSFWQKKNIKI